MKGIGRLIKALEDGWGFQYLKVTPHRTSRHSLWVTNEKMGGWICVKVPGIIPKNEVLDALLDEAGVPR